MTPELDRGGARATGRTTARVPVGERVRRSLLPAGVGGVRVPAAERPRTAAETWAAEVLDGLESTSDMYVGVDAHWTVTYINAQAAQRLGVHRDRVIGADLWEAFPALLGTAFEQCFRGVMRTGEPAGLEEHYRAAELWCEVRAHPLRGGGIGVHLRDVAERRAMAREREQLLLAERTARAAAEQAEHDLAHRAAHDDLTGLLNRAGLRQHVESALSWRPDADVTVAFIDLDRFKLVNDSLGHGTGDEVLAVFARRLTALAGPADLVARFGGDEFVVVLVGAPVEEADRLAAEIISASRQPVETDGRLLVTASVGLARMPGNADLERLLREADAALNRAKEAGRERAAWFDQQMHLDSVRRVQTDRDLRSALVRGELFLHYQPAFDLRREGIRHIEALARWRSPTRGLVFPDHFIPVAEESDLIERIGDWVISSAVRQAAEWSHVPGLRVWVNVSPRQLVDPAVPDLIVAELAAVGLPAERLGIEVTESALADQGRLAEMLQQLRRLGLAVAIDDFGTGYSSLARLGRCPVDVLKIDRSFVAELGSVRGNAVVASMVTLAHAFDAHVIAEGVQTLAQLTTLRTLGVDSASGYLLARPAAADELPLHREPSR